MRKSNKNDKIFQEKRALSEVSADPYYMADFNCILKERNREVRPKCFTRKENKERRGILPAAKERPKAKYYFIVI